MSRSSLAKTTTPYMIKTSHGKSRWYFVHESGLNPPRAVPKPRLVFSKPTSPRLRMTNFFNNSTTAFNDDEISIMRRTETEEAPIFMQESNRQLSRLDLAKEQKINSSKVRITEDKHENIRVVANFETRSLYTPRSTDFGSDDENNVFISQPESVQQLPPIENDKQFISDLKDNIMKFAEEREDKPLEMHEFSFALNKGNMAIERPKYGRKRVISTVHYYTDKVSIKVESKINPDMENTFSLPRMEKFLYTNGLPIPKIIDRVCINKKYN